LDWRTFFIEFLKAVTWPTAAVAMLLLLRRPLTELLKLTRRFKYQELEIEFGREISAASQKIGETQPLRVRTAMFERIERIALEQPALAVIDAWREVEASLVEFAKRKELKVAPSVWVMPLILNALLFTEDHISQSQHEVISRLKSLRDRITHVPDFAVSAEEAMKYVELAERVVAMLTQDGGPATA
jgi:hypothetical protein